LWSALLSTLLPALLLSGLRLISLVIHIRHKYTSPFISIRFIFPRREYSTHNL
jgi:hypothetical protein